MRRAPRFFQLRFGDGKLRDGGLLADEEPERGDHVDDELAVDAERLLDLLAPLAQARLVLHQEREHQIGECPDDGGVRDAPRELIELAGQEEAPPDQGLLQLVDENGLADARVPGHQDELRSPGVGHALERAEQQGNLLLPAVELLGDPEAVRHVPLAQGERLDLLSGAPLREAPLEVVPEAAGALVPVFDALGEELQDDARDRLRHLRDDLGRRRGRAGDVTVDPLQRIPGLERQPPRQHLEERDAK